jgi:hypothetical protein
VAYIIRGSNEDKFARTEVHFEGGREALDLFFKTTKAYPGTIEKASWVSGTVIPPEVMPKQVRITKGREIFDWLTVRGGGTLVSASFKAAVVEIEPEQHQFFPVTVVDKTGAARPEEFFIFNVVGRIDSIVEDQSNLRASGRGQIEGWGYERKVGPWKCALNAAVIGGRACWIERRYLFRWFVSDRLAALLEQKGLCGFTLGQLAGEHCDEITV